VIHLGRVEEIPARATISKQLDACYGLRFWFVAQPGRGDSAFQSQLLAASPMNKMAYTERRADQEFLLQIPTAVA